MSHGGKGSSSRPYSVSQREYDSRWDAIFGRDLPIDIPDKIVDNTVTQQPTTESTHENTSTNQ